jgi:Xaa-Pro aminopeptidase
VLGEADQTALRDGNVVTFELAIWQDGEAGAFAEDTVVVREAGLEWLIDDGHEPIVIS